MRLFQSVPQSLHSPAGHQQQKLLQSDADASEVLFAA
jgi:hypothetical protein